MGPRIANVAGAAYVTQFKEKIQLLIKEIIPVSKELVIRDSLIRAMFIHVAEN